MNDSLIERNDTTAVELDPHFGNRHGMIETIAKQTVHSMRSQLGRRIVRGGLGSIFGGRR